MMMATSMQKHAVKHNKKSPPDAGFFLKITGAQHENSSVR